MTTLPLLPARLACGIVAALLLAPWHAVGARQPATDTAPTLLVLVVVDQMRAEYLTRYSGAWTGGLRRLIDQGAAYEQAAYPYLNTVTCVGHATLGTGAWPKTHGIILNQWYRRDLGAMKSCTADPTVRTIVYGGTAEREGHSAVQLKVPTLAERLRARWPESRAVSLSLKPRSAIMMAGKGATAVTWIGAGGWQSSTAYTPEPIRSVARVASAHAPDLDRRAVWQPMREAASYQGQDDGRGERPQFGWTTRFPHPLDASGTAAGFLENWQSSPYGDAAVGALARAAIDDFQLGQRGVVDFLGVSFSSTDLVGHDFGPDSHEVQDTLARLDLTLGELLTALDERVGRHRYALVLSADHGVATVPEVTAATGRSAGRVALGLVRDTADKVLDGLGPRPHVARVEYTEIYFTEPVRATMTSARVAPVLKALRSMPGVQAAFWGPDLAKPQPGVPAAIVAAVRASHVPERSGDITIVPAPNWILVPGSSPAGGTATTHGSPNPYDQRVPLVFLGPMFTAGRYQDAASPADAAPTLAATIGLVMTGVEGRPLTASIRQARAKQ